MSDAPERIWLQYFDTNDSDEAADYRNDPDWKPDDATWCEDIINDTDVPYIRADLAGLPEEHVKWLRQMREEIVAEGHAGWGNAISLVLDWHESQGAK